MTTSTMSLKEQYAQYKIDNPKSRIRDAAKALGVSEAELLMTNIGSSVIKLEGDWKALLGEVIHLGKVMGLTRNDDAVHERKGIYDNLSFHGPVGTFVNPDIDLRLFMMHWAFGFAVHENDRKSLQFFDKSGEAVHKIYLLEASNHEAYETIVAQYRAANQEEALQCTAYAAPKPPLPDAEIDVHSFQEDWKALVDTHDFYGMLQKHKVTRTQALRLAPEGFAKEVSNDFSRKLLDAAAAQQVPIMVFVGNRGCIQIHTGEVVKLMETGPWYNVLDPEFNLHLNETKIANTWLVKKPSADGIINSVEVFDANGEMIVQFFGKRKPGIPELESWRTILDELV